MRLHKQAKQNKNGEYPHSWIGFGKFEDMWPWQSNKKAYEQAQSREIKKSFPLRTSLLKVWALSWQETLWYPLCCLRLAFCVCYPLVSGPYSSTFSPSVWNGSNKNICVCITSEQHPHVVTWSFHLNYISSGYICREHTMLKAISKVLWWQGWIRKDFLMSEQWIVANYFELFSTMVGLWKG